MDWTLEPARPEDIDAILTVMRHHNMHHVPSAEMDALDWRCFFVARAGGRVVGAAGYRILSPAEGKTTLLGVLPEYGGLGIGKALQARRMRALHEAGVRWLTTNADRPETIFWYQKHFGYRPVGTLAKRIPFGREDIGHWTTLRTDLEAYFAGESSRAQRRRAWIASHDPHPLAPYPPLIINACLTGMVPTRAQSPHVPVNPDEIIAAAIDVYDAGARMVHLHARDADGTPSSDPAYYDRIIRGIRRERPGLVCVATTSGRAGADFERRAAVLFLDPPARPEMASLTLGSLNFASGASVNTIDTVGRLAIAMREQGVKPELEVFDSGMVNLALWFERHGIVGGRKYFNLLLGNLNTAPATLASLGSLVAALPPDSAWGAAGIGVFQLPMNVAAIIGGGHVRVGLEDNLHYDTARTRLATNRDLVERVARLAAELQRPLATADETREILGLPPGPPQ